MLVVLTICLCTAVANAQTAPLQAVNVSQVKWLNPVLAGGVDWGGAPAGQNIAVNTSAGEIFVGTNSQFEMFNEQTGVVTNLTGTTGGGRGSFQGVAIDAQNNLYVTNAYSPSVVKVPYLGNGAYAVLDTGTKTACANFGANSSLDTASCYLPNLTFSGNSYYFQIENLVLDAQGDLFWEMMPSYGEGAIWECSVACLGGTGNPFVVFQEPTATAKTQLQIGGMAFDPWGNLFFTDESGGGTTSNLNELPVSTGAGYGGATTGFAAAPTVLYSYTPASAGDEIDGVATDPVTGTVYFATLYSGVFAYPNSAGVVNTAQLYGISPQGSKVLALDGKNNPVVVSYEGTGDTVGTILVNNLAFPGSVQAGNSVTTAYNTTVSVGTPPVATVETGSYVTVMDSMTTCTADPTLTLAASGANAAEFSVASTTIVPPATALLNPPCSGVLNGGASYPVTISFMPAVGAMSTQSAAITATDSASNSGTAAVTGTAPAPVFVTQVNWLNNLAGGGAFASGNPAGSSFGVNSATGDVIIGNSYGNKVLDINSTTGVETVLVDWGSDIGQNYNVGPVTLDSQNNLYVGGLYTNNVIKIPFVSGAYAAAPYPATTPANCTGSDTAECNFGSNLTNATNGYYFGIGSMTFDAAGDFFFSLTNANTAPEAIYECTVACLATGTPAATMIYMEPASVTTAQLTVGGLAVDPWGNLFFTDSDYISNKNESVYSELNELPVSTGAGYGGATTGYAAAPTVIYTETLATPGSYDDELDGVAVDAVTGTVYLADQYNGVVAFQNNAGTVNPAGIYTVSTQGAKVIALDAKDNLYGAVYSSALGSSGDTVFEVYVNSVLVPGLAGTTANGVTFPGSVMDGTSADTTYNLTVQVGTPAVATVETGSSVTVVDNGTTCTADPSITVTSSDGEFSAEDTIAEAPGTVPLDAACSGTMSGAASYPTTVTFAPVIPDSGTVTGTLTVTDSAGNSGVATASGVALALKPQTITLTNPTTATETVTYGVAPIVLGATGGASGNAVTFSLVSGPATLGDDGATLTITGVGTVVVDANQAGNTSYSAAPQVAITITVVQASQTITFAPTSPVTFSTTPIALTATGGASGNPVTFTVTSGPGTISGSSLTLTGLGTVVVAADQAGDANYTAAATVSASILVNAIGTVGTPSFTPASGTALYLGESPITLGETIAGATIYYTIGTTGTTPTAASTKYTSAGIPVPTTVGTYTIEAIAVELGYTTSAVASATYTVSSIPPDFTFDISPKNLTITAGQSGTLTATITPLHGFDSKIVFSCSGLPNGATCPQVSVTPDGVTPISGTITITTTAASLMASSKSNPLVPGTTLAVALCCFLGFKKRRRLQMILLLAVSAIGMSLFTGCGAQWSPTFSITTVQVAARSGAFDKTQDVTITVNK
jgi:hypothetical protein